MTSTPTARGTRLPAAFQARGFGRLSAAWVFTNLGDSALYLMVAVWVKEFTGSDVAAGFVFVALGVPAVLAPFIGALADRVPRKWLLVANNVAYVPIVLLLLLVSGPAQLWLVYAVIFFYAAGAYVTAAAQSGILREMLRDDQLASGNGVLTTIDNGLRLISPLVGTALYVWIGPYAVVALTAGCFAISALILVGLQVSAERPTRSPSRGYVRELVAGFEHLGRVAPLRKLTLALAIAFGATGLINIIVFPALDAMEAEPATIGWLVPLQGAGALIGGVFSATLVTRLGEGRAAALGMALLATGTGLLMLASLPLAAVGMVVAGLGIPVTVVAFSTLRQRITPAELQGRTAAAGNVAINVPQTMVAVLGAGLLGVVDYRILIGVTVTAILAGGLLAAFAHPRPVGE